MSEPFPVGVYVRTGHDETFFGIHDVWSIPRKGEVIRLHRHDQDHRLTVVSVEHNLSPAHSVRLVCEAIVS